MTVLNDVPLGYISFFQYGISLVTNNSDIMVEIKEINSSVTIGYQRMIL
jgi:hypothetical protein